MDVWTRLLMLCLLAGVHAYSERCKGTECWMEIQEYLSEWYSQLAEATKEKEQILWNYINQQEETLRKKHESALEDLRLQIANLRDEVRRLQETDGAAQKRYYDGCKGTKCWKEIQEHLNKCYSPLTEVTKEKEKTSWNYINQQEETLMKKHESECAIGATVTTEEGTTAAVAGGTNATAGDSANVTEAISANTTEAGATTTTATETTVALGRSRCYDEINRPQRCIPEFVNAAFNRRVEATNTCGDPPVQFCVQNGAYGLRKQCGSCNASDPRNAHPPSHLTDDDDDNRRMTWWQSETMLQGVQYPNTINLTLNLGKTFEITYVRLKFHSSQPESFAIFKKTRENGEWEPYQFYSASCRNTYQKQTNDIIMRDKEAMPICTDEYSDISPLTGGNVAFSTLEERPSSYNIENSRELQEWVSASAIKIMLTRLNTFGDEVNGDPNVLESYFYAISDLSVDGRCKCNGHASSCTQSNGQDIEDRLVCVCEHNTDGADCDRCLPFYNDGPWWRATAQNAHECMPCDCSGLSNTCFFDEELYRRTGHGGHCTNCLGNTTGPHCETCLDGFYRHPQDMKCVPCQCSETGSIVTSCGVVGRCTCKPGVIGDKCDRCAPNHFGFSASDCQPCQCNVSGSIPHKPMCDANSGRCHCKSNVEGRRCDTCKLGFFGLDGQNQFGCLPS